MKQNHKTDSTRIRRHYSAKEKVLLPRVHLVDGPAISTICDEHQILPTRFRALLKAIACTSRLRDSSFRAKLRACPET